MTHSFEPIPPSQLFRALLLHMLETHKVLTPYVQHTTSKALKLCHSQNTYILSEIESWLEDQLEDLDLTPSFSVVQFAGLRDGVVSCLTQPPAGVVSATVAKTADLDQTPGIRRAPSSRRSAATPVKWERNSDGKIIFRPKSSSEKPSSI